MATDSIGLALAEELAKKNGDKVQYFQIRNDSRSGGTIGPAISTSTGARTIDLGIPQLSMHSIRATLGSKDIGLGIKFFYGFFKNWRDVYDNFADLQLNIEQQEKESLKVYLQVLVICKFRPYFNYTKYMLLQFFISLVTKSNLKIKEVLIIEQG